jgi:hypothetical protein
VFSGRLHEPDTATAVREFGGEVLTSDGPFVESKEHLDGFYIIETKDLDEALAWAARVTAQGERALRRGWNRRAGGQRNKASWAAMSAGSSSAITAQHSRRR